MSVDQPPPTERWGTKLGVILAVAGSAVGLGNFLRFPGQAAKYGGGAFMIPYFLAFLLVGIPMCWAEWTMGRYGGRFGFHSAPGIFGVLWRRPVAKFIGALGLMIPVVIYMYYVYLESWCLAYAYMYATGNLDLGRNPAVYQNFFGSLIGVASDGAVFQGEIRPIFWFFLITFAANFYFIYRGLSKGIERFSKIAMPILILSAIVVVIRVLTLPEQPLPVPWQQSLAQEFPARQWEELRLFAIAPTTTPAQVRDRVSEELTQYYRRMLDKDPSYKGDIPVAIPAGFAATPAGFAVAIAELRQPKVGEQFERWEVDWRERLDQTTKLQLQDIERDQLAAEGVLTTLVSQGSALTASQRPIDERLEFLRSELDVVQDEQQREILRGEQVALEAAIADSSRRLQTLEQRQAQQRTEIAALEASRATILASLDPPMPRLTEALMGISWGEGTPSLDQSQALALQERSAALRISELRRTVFNGLGYMWNPDFSQLANPEMWIAAAGQIFFSLSVGFGIILTYASYLRKNDDVVLSGLTASSTNEFCEVILGGLVAIPATFMFLGTATTLEVINSGSTFGLGFNTLPAVFANMPVGGRWFGALWFFLLFLAGITSSLSMLQPAIAFLEEGFGLRRRASVAALGLMTLSGSLAVVYFSYNVTALDTMDFWVGSVAIFVLATIEVLLFGWVIGVDEGFAEAHRGADMRIPRFFGPILRYVTPVFLLTIFGAWLFQNLAPSIERIMGNPVVLLTVCYLVVILFFLVLMIGLAGERWKKEGRGEREVEQ